MTDTKSRAEVFSHSASQHYAVFQLNRFLTLTALGVEQNSYAADLQGRHLAFMNNLINPQDERFTYEVRVVSRPDPQVYTRGSLAIALVCRMDNVQAKEAKDYAGHLLNLLRASFDEYEFKAAPGGEISSWLNPFEPQHLVQLNRRFEIVPINSLIAGKSIRKIGFSSSSKPRAKQKSDRDGQVETIFHIYPFIPTWSSFALLCRLLLFEEQPFIISSRLKPTVISETEAAFLEEQIAHCEGIMHVLPSLQTALRLQAQVYEQMLTSRLYGLRDNAALATLEIASSRPIPAPVIDALGSLVTESAGGKAQKRAEGFAEYLSGGYVFDVLTDKPAKAAFKSLAINPSSGPGVPKDAGRLPFLFDTSEAAAVFRFPPSTIDPPLGLPCRNWRLQPPSKNLPDKGCPLGVSNYGGSTQNVRVSSEDRKRHVYIVGQTGTGKSSLLKTMILEDMKAGEGLCVIDPHGDLFRELLERIPEHRIDDVVLLDPTDAANPIGLNLLEAQTQPQRFFIAQEFVGIMRRLLRDDYGSQASAFAGPMFFQHMRMNMLLAMSRPSDPGTLLEFHNIYNIADYWKRWVPLHIQEPVLERWVEFILPAMDYIRPGSEGASMGSYLSSKFEGFIFDPLLRNIFGQKRTSVNLRSVMDEGKILLVNLAKGELTEENSRFFGMILMAKLMLAAMGRVQLPQAERRQFNLYVDEFQNIATGSFVTLVSEARKFGLSLILANQFLTQIDDAQILQSIFGNV